MTVKDTVIKGLLENEYEKKIVNLQVVTGADTPFDVALGYTELAIAALPTGSAPELTAWVVNQIFADNGYVPV